jgi:plastocyanin
VRLRGRLRPCLATLALLAACSHDEGVPARGPATPLDPATTGTIAGSVRFEGEPPPETQIQMAGDPACTAPGSAKVGAGDVRVVGGRVENAFVYLKSGLEGRVFPLPTTPVVIDQRGCMYQPRLAGAETGQEIVLVNSDPTLHNVHTSPVNSPPTNFGMAVAGSRRSIRVAKPEVMVKIQCDVHPWMRAYLGVLDHPYFAVTRRDGSFRLENVPAGEYTLAVWHERLGTQETKVSVAAKGSAAVEIRLGG